MIRIILDKFYFFTFIMCMLLYKQSFSAEIEYSLNNEILERLKLYQIEVHKPGSSLDYSYSNSRIPMNDFIQGNISPLGDEFIIEKSLKKVNHKADKKLILHIRNEIINRMSNNKQTLMAYLGYHDIVPAFARKTSSTDLEKLPLVKEHTFHGRYGQKFKAICGISSERKGFIILLPGRGGHIKGFWEGVSDYSNSAAKIYFNSLNMNVCSLSILTLPDIALKRYGLSAMGVNLSIVSDFLYWINENKRLQPVILGGVSNGGHVAEYAALLFDDVKGVISSGAAARYDYPLSQHSEVSFNNKSIKFQNSPYTALNQALRSGKIFELLTHKMLLISIGTHDAGIVNDGPDKFDQLYQAKQAFKKSKNKDCMEINLFYGNHAMEPVGEVEKIKKLIENCSLLK